MAVSQRRSRSFLSELLTASQRRPAIAAVAGAAAVLATTAIVNRHLARKAQRDNPPQGRFAVAKGSAPHSVLQRLIKTAEIVPVPGGFEPACDALATGKADVYGENLHLAYRIADFVPGAHVLPGHFNVVQKWRSGYASAPPQPFPWSTCL
jgi:hypothetical protein